MSSYGKAKTLTAEQLQQLLEDVHSNPRPLSMQTAFMLSYYAGLRVQEIAGLEWNRHIFDTQKNIRIEEFPEPDARGRVRNVKREVIQIDKQIGKYGRPRSIIMHPHLSKNLRELYAESDGVFVITSGKKGASQELKPRAHALKMRLNRIYTQLGFEGCSSHSGRRTVITKWARNANLHGCSLVDVQAMAGHGHLTTTQGYIEVSPQQASLVSGVWD